jgi:hypothetical protein
MIATVALIVVGFVVQSRCARGSSGATSGKACRRSAGTDSSANADSSAKLFQAREHLQTAMDQAAQAEYAAAAANNGDRNQRLGAAERARYHASAARAAADRSTGAASGGGTAALDAAAQARAAADRAQNAANNATYTAST